MITRSEFNGRIFCTRATAHACKYLLRDSAKIQEGDAAYLNYKTARIFLNQLKTAGGKSKISESDQQEIKALLKSGDNDCALRLRKRC